MSSGGNVAPYVPAVMKTANAPWERIFPSRIVIAGMPPNSPKRLEALSCSYSMKMDMTLAVKAMTFTVRITSSLSLIANLRTKYPPMASRNSPSALMAACWFIH